MSGERERDDRRERGKTERKREKGRKAREEKREETRGGEERTVRGERREVRREERKRGKRRRPGVCRLDCLDTQRNAYMGKRGGGETSGEREREKRE